MFSKTILIFISVLIAIVNSEKLIIIGAGVAGIAAATRLLESGYNDLLILEAENRIGGRIQTIAFGANVIDIGGQWCHGEEGNVVFELAAPLNLLEKSTNNYTHSSNMKIYGMDINATITLNMMMFYVKCFEDQEYLFDPKSFNLNQSLGDYMTNKFYKFIEADDMLKHLSKNVQAGLLDYFHKSVLILDAAYSWNDLSLRAESDYHAATGFHLWQWKDKGYQTILDVLMKKLPDSTKQLPINDKILLNKEVNKIEWNNDDNQVKVDCNDGTSYKADKILTTVSIGVLKTEHKTLFSPQLPELKQNAINEIEMGAVAKLFLLFNKPWWPDTTDNFNILWTNESKQQFKQHFPESDNWLLDISDCHRVDYQPNMLLFWLCTESVRKMEELDVNLVKEKLMKLVHFLFDSDYNITEPIDFQRSKWLTNSHFRGAYSYHGYKSTENSTRQLAESVVNMNGYEVVYFGGEASSFHHFSTVHGAIESGWREADKILKKNS